MKVLERTQFGDPILRGEAKPVAVASIKSASLQNLIKDMRHTLQEKKLGIGLAAPQVGVNKAVAVIEVRPTKLRPKAKEFSLVLINPKITKTNGLREFWEGCISSGPGGKAGLFAKVPRHTEIQVTFYDEKGKRRTEKHKGLNAQVIQHEVDHLGGILFVDRVENTKTYMTYSEYKKRIRNRK